MTTVGEHLSARGITFEAVPHTRSLTTLDEARALGLAADAVLKTVVLKTRDGHALAVVPANRRLSMRLARRATADSHVRLATEAELRRSFPDHELAAVPPLGELLGVPLFVDPEVMDHDRVAFAAGTQTESVVVDTTELFAGEHPTVLPLVTREEDEHDQPERAEPEHDEPAAAPADESAAPAHATRVGPVSELPARTVTGAGRYVVGNIDGTWFALSRRCRHLGADLAEGSIDDDGCLVCPWHHAKYDVATGRMVRGPRGAFARIPGLDAAYRALTRVLPLRRRKVEIRDDTVYVRRCAGRPLSRSRAVRRRR